MFFGLLNDPSGVADDTPRLSRVAAGRTVTVSGFASGAEASRLAEMGMGAGQRVRVLCDGDPFVCQVGECRIGLCRRLAECVLVDHGVKAGDDFQLRDDA